MGINLGPLESLILGIIGLAIMLAGASVIMKSNRNQYAETARVGFNVFVGIVIVALGAGTVALVAFGERILRAFGLGG